ncbi:TPA: hypothetical protein ACV5OD_001171 [Citrobacter freundii]|nr:MAG TPA: hypothetical protein [Caudoviricetes sp.]
MPPLLLVIIKQSFRTRRVYMNQTVYLSDWLTGLKSLCSTIAMTMLLFI